MDRALPQVAGALDHPHRAGRGLERGLAAGIEADDDLFARPVRVTVNLSAAPSLLRRRPHRVEKRRQERHHPRQVRRAAGDLEVGGALDPAFGRQGVGVEEAVAGEGDAREEAVVEDALDHVQVARLAARQEHQVVPQVVADGGAGLRVGGLVRQLVGHAEGLEGVGDPASQVELARHQVVPHAPERLAVTRRAGASGHVRHAGVEVHRPHRMAFDVPLRGHRFVVLPVVPVVVDGEWGVLRVRRAVVPAAALVEGRSGPGPGSAGRRWRRRASPGPARSPRGRARRGGLRVRSRRRSGRRSGSPRRAASGRRWRASGPRRLRSSGRRRTARGCRRRRGSSAPGPAPPPGAPGRSSGPAPGTRPAPGPRRSGGRGRPPARGARSPGPRQATPSARRRPPRSPCRCQCR